MANETQLGGEEKEREKKLDSIRFYIPPFLHSLSNFSKFRIFCGGEERSENDGTIRYWMEEGRDRGPQEIDPRARDVERRYEPRADLISRLAAVIASLASTFDGTTRSFLVRVANSTIEIARNTHGGDVSTVLDK